MQLRFILNDSEIACECGGTEVLVDFIRKHRSLTGTTVACREGDCGACTVLVGSIGDEGLSYRSITSCIYPLANVCGKHVVTVEGLNGHELNPVQEAIAACNGTQCGFCTPGFVVSLAGVFLKKGNWDFSDGVAAIDGNICRCTGYKSIERAIRSLCEHYSTKEPAVDLKDLVSKHIIPPYFLDIEKRLRAMKAHAGAGASIAGLKVVGGGTDLYVQIPEKMQHTEAFFSCNDDRLNFIRVSDVRCEIGAATSIEELRESKLINGYWPNIGAHLKLFGSTQIRQQATLGGNLMNASPIGDTAILMLALNATVVLRAGNTERLVPLRSFYKGYKKMDRCDDELLAALHVTLPAKDSRFNFEKVSRRTYLDIASVNSAFNAVLHKDGKIASAALSAGGVAPIPLYLEKTSQGLASAEVNVQTVKRTAELALCECSPIDDVRGSAAYKRLLLRQLIYAHFITCFPERISFEALQ